MNECGVVSAVAVMVIGLLMFQVVIIFMLGTIRKEMK